MAPYVDVDRMQSADGVTAIISQRRATGLFTFSIHREFERDGFMEKTFFITETGMESYLAMLTMVREKIAKLIADREAKLGHPVGTSSAPVGRRK